MNNIDNCFDIRISTKHIVKNDVFFCFKNAEKYLTNEILEKVSKIYVEGSFFDRIQTFFNENFTSNVLEKYKDKIIEIESDKIKDELVRQLQHRYKIPKTLLAITGTKGKTSTSWYVLQLLSNCGLKAGYIGTIGAYYNIGNGVEKLNKEDILTTPDIDDLYIFLDKMYQIGVEVVVFESSSHSLQQGRIDGLQIDIAGFTNLSQDHLDYHKTMEEYFNAKCLLFSKYLNKNGFAIINSDDNKCDNVIGVCTKAQIETSNIISFGTKENKNHSNGCKILSTEQTSKYQKIEIEHNNKKYEINTKIIGEFQAHNIVMAILFAENYFNLTNIKDNNNKSYNSNLFEDVVKYAETLQAPLGRMQRVLDTNIFIDYAHTPKSMQESLTLLDKIYSKVIVVFGCGGDRDKMKRPLMFEISKRLADIVFVTNDNPRTENDKNIIKDIVCFYTKSKNELKENSFVLDEMKRIQSEFKTIKSKKYKVQKDRRKAIKQAVKIYQKQYKKNNDIALLIAGKGHEDYQIIGRIKYHLSDYEEVIKNLK